MRSSNPVLKRAIARQGGPGQSYQAPYGQGAPYQQGYGQQPYGQSPYGQAPYGQTQYGQDPYSQQMYPPQTGTPGSERMTIDDVVVRTAMTLGVLILTAVPTYFLTWGDPGLGIGLTMIGAIGGLILGLVIGFKQSTSAPLILIYGALEGLFVGGISAVFEGMLPGTVGGTPMGSLVTGAVFGTIFAFATVLGLYKFNIIRVTGTFMKVVIGATVALVAFLLVNFLLSFFIEGGLGLREPSPLGIAVSAIAIILACAMLLIEFKQIDDALTAGVERKFAWQCAFGLTITLVWIYVEILRLLWMIQMLFSE